MPSRGCRAFTLVELMVVVGIIAVLMGILLPAMSRARRSAWQVRCAANIRQIGQFYAMYACNNHGRYPMQVNHDGYAWGNWPFGDFGGTSDRAGGTIGAGPGTLVMTGYIKDPRVLFCPNIDQQTENTFFNWSRQRSSWVNAAGRPNAAGLTNAYAGYAFWAGLGRPDLTPAQSGFGVWADPDYAKRFAYRATSPATSVICSDILGDSTHPVFALKSNHLDGQPHKVWHPQPGVQRNIIVQGNGGNVLYNDGHAVWRRAEEMTVRFRLSYVYDTSLAF